MLGGVSIPTVMTPDGVKPIFTKEDMLEIARDYVSDDFAKYIDNAVTACDEESQRVALEFQSDYRGLESSSEEYYNSLVDAVDTLHMIMGEIEYSKRLDKRKLYEQLRILATALQNEI